MELCVQLDIELFARIYTPKWNRVLTSLGNE